MTVSYSGDQPIASAILRGYLPWQGGVRALNCTTQNASNCAVDTRFNSVNATFDILPGGSISIDGQARLVDADGFQPYFGVATYGPISLSEADTANNFARHLYGEVP